MGNLDTFRRAAVIAAKALGWLVGAVVLLLVVAMWRDARQEKERQAKLDAMFKPAAQHWQIVNAAKGTGPAAWAINTEDGSVMFCVANQIDIPSCENASR